jgi:uncharacterized protein
VSRNVGLDVVRGFALFGVLLLNMYGFGAESVAWDSVTDRLVFSVTHVFFDSKAWTLLSILFGIGTHMQIQRISRRGDRLSLTYLRRLLGLFAFGVANALLHDGDILMLYAQLGLALLVVHRFSTRNLLFLAVVLMLVFPLSHFATPDRLPGAEFSGNVQDARAALELEKNHHVLATGSFSDVISYNATEIPPNPVSDYNWADSGLTTFAMFILGFVIARSGVPAGTAERQLRLVHHVRNWGLGTGLAAMAAEQLLTVLAGYEVFRPSTATRGVVLAGDLLFSFGTVALALGYAAMLVLAVRTETGKVFLSPLAGVGRMALTVYLTQTLVFTTLFHGYGFGAAYRLGPAMVTGLTFVIFTAQVAACQWWLRRFRFGPAEWLWRSFTYMEWQPLRIDR